jgi:hypothetical protein
VLAPDNVAVPAVVLLTPPVPASAALTVPACISKVPDDDNVPFCSVPPVSVRPPFCVWVVPPRSSVPPFIVVALPMLPSVPAPEICKVPAFTIVPPK